MPGLAVLFWLSKQLLSVRRVSRTLSVQLAASDQVIPSFHPILQALSHFDWRLVR